MPGFYNLTSDARRAANANAKAKLFRYEGTISEADVQKQRRVQSDLCRYCRVELHGEGHLDHIIAQSRGGSNWPSNIQLTCAPCNQAKGVLSHEEFETKTHCVPPSSPESGQKSTESPARVPQPANDPPEADPDELARLKAENTALRTQVQVLEHVTRQKFDRSAQERDDARNWRDLCAILKKATAE